MRSRRAPVGLIAVVLALAACPPDAPRDAIVPWLTCLDCPLGQLDSVRALYARAPGPIGDALLGHALRGPRGADSVWVWDNLMRALVRDSAWIAHRPGVPPLTSPLARAVFYFKAYRATWRARATIALAVVKDPRACVVVDSLTSPTDTASAVIRRALRMARDSLGGCPP
jgi:hypothetical protein